MGTSAHLGVDPDDELITGVAVTAANTADRDVIDELLGQPGAATRCRRRRLPTADEPAAGVGGPRRQLGNDSERSESKDFEVYGDSAYADGATLDEQTARGHDMRTKVPPVRNPNGYSKDQFSIDLAAGTVTCPAITP